MDFFRNLFKTTPKYTVEDVKETVNFDDNQKLNKINDNLNLILKDLLKTIQPNEDNNLPKLLALNEPDKCNKITLFLSKNLEKDFLNSITRLK